MTSPERQASAFSSWLDSPGGERVWAWCEEVVGRFVADVFGFYAIQLGLPQRDLLAYSRIPWRWRCDPEGGEVRTAWDELPFESNALDLVVAPFALDRSADPHALLRELERVLVPEGHALFFGFNPWYPWRLLSRHERWPRLPGSMTVPRLKDRLLVLGFEPRGGRFGMYAPPGERLPRARRAFEAAVDRWWPLFGGVYVLDAVKRVPGMRIIQPDWQNRKKQRAERLAAIAECTKLKRES